MGRFVDLPLLMTRCSLRIYAMGKFSGETHSFGALLSDGVLDRKGDWNGSGGLGSSRIHGALLEHGDRQAAVIGVERNEGSERR